MYLDTEDEELIEALLLSGWTRGESPTQFYWPTSRMPRA
jgi:hypothetical protein